MIEFLDHTPLLALLVLVPVLAAALWVSLVDRPRGRRAAAWALRVLGVVLLVVALCRPYMNLSHDALHVAFLVDVSESVDLAAAASAMDEVEQAIAALGAGDSWTLFALGRGLRAYGDPDALRTELAQWRDGASDDAFRSATQIAGALRQVRLALPDDKSRRVVLLSDHRPTDAKLDEALAMLGREQIDVHVGDVTGLRDAEAAVVSVKPSTRQAFDGEMVRLTVRMAANTAMSGELRILSRGAVVARTDVQLAPDGENRVALDVTMHTPGPSVWTAELVPERDRFPVNNQVSTTIDVQGQPRLLVLHEAPREMRAFARALEQQQFSVDVRPAHGLPETMNDMLAFDAIVLAQVPAIAFSTRQMMLLKRYVADFGGGLMMLGSDQSFGLGGYYRTPVEDVLPLVSRYEQEQEQPSMAMVLVIDKSGSMDGMPIALARQAAKAAVDMLGPRDRVGVVGFDSQAYVISDIRAAADRQALHDAIDTIGAGGGTYMFVGMEHAKQMLERVSARIKHMIVLGDGMTQPADHLGLVDELLDLNVTVSTVALGPSADRHLLSTIAEQGRGRYYETLDATQVPQIFTHETMQASRSAIKEDVFASVPIADHPATAGFGIDDLPYALGYVMTQARPTAQVLLITDTGDPLLAVSRFGLGTGMAFTSDLTPRWGGLWLNWSSFGQYWGQVFRALVRSTDDAGLIARNSADEQTWQVRISRHDAAGEPVTGVSWDADVIDAGGGRRPVTIREVGLGEYRAEVPVEHHRRLTLRMHDTDHGKLKAIHYDRLYPPEYQLEARVSDALVSQPTFVPDRIRAGTEPVRRGRDVMPWLVLSAIVCLITGIALRRL